MNVKNLRSNAPFLSPSGHPLRIVVLDSPYDTIQSQQTQNFFGRLAAFKIRSYQKEYPDGVLPVDTVDFVATHLLLCEQIGDEIQPLMGMKSITHRRCLRHNLQFPALHLVESQELKAHHDAIEEYLRKAALAGETVAYNGSWTIDPGLRVHREFVRLCWDVTVAFFVFHYSENHIQSLAGATLRFKIHDFKEFMGFSYLGSPAGQLSSFECQPFFGEKVALMVLNGCSPQAVEVAERYRFLWQNRLVIGKDTTKESEELMVA